MIEEGRLVSGRGTQVSIIIPTYNESQNILKILKSIGEFLPKNILAEAIVVDYNSPDGTGKIVENYLKEFKILKNKKKERIKNPGFYVPTASSAIPTVHVTCSESDVVNTIPVNDACLANN